MPLPQDTTDTHDLLQHRVSGLYYVQGSGFAEHRDHATKLTPSEAQDLMRFGGYNAVYVTVWGHDPYEHFSANFMD